MTSSFSPRTDKGTTLVELLVAMTVSSILLISVVSASLVLERFLKYWHEKDAVAEEVAFLHKELARQFASSRAVQLFRDSLICVTPQLVKTSYDWGAGAFRRNGVSLTPSNIHVDSLTVSRIQLQNDGHPDILKSGDENARTGIYAVYIAVSTANGTTYSLRTVVRNEYEYFTSTNF
jgi:Tfp pilus assembly protein FimT